MNNCRAGLYSFASTTVWLHETGVASPPLLVMLGLTLPNSRVLSGIAGIGLTLANIAAILPHLRQPILSSLHIPKGALLHEQITQERTPDMCNAAQPVHLPEEAPVPASVSACEKQRQMPTLACSATVESIYLTDTELLWPANIEFETAAQIKPLSTAGKLDDGSTPRHASPSRDADFTERHIDFGHLFARESQGALYVPLPVSGAEEVAFFDTEDDRLSCSDLGEEWSEVACEQCTIPEQHLAIEGCGPTSEKSVEQDDQLVGSDLPLLSTQGRSETGVDSTEAAMVFCPNAPVGRYGNLTAAFRRPVTGEKEPPALAPERRSQLLERTISGLPDVCPAHEDTVQGLRAERSFVAGKPGKYRPECLEFIPQSVIRRYPSVLMTPAGHYFGRSFNPTHDHQASPHVFVRNSAMLLGGTRPRVSHTTLLGHRNASFLTDVHRTKRSAEVQTFVTQTVPAQDSFEQEPAPPPKSSTAHELTPFGRNPIRRRCLGVLARAHLRDRRSAAQRHRDDGDSGSSTSGSDSAFDSDSQYSSRSSAYESMLPHMLGADLIAAIDANSESELNLTGCRRTKRTPLNVYGDFLISDDSEADISMIMRASSHDDVSDGETGNRATFRSLTHEEIRQWASGVVQKCVRQVCRNRVPAEPLSPSQASDVCAERPSGSGVSQCPLSGLHCKLGAVATTDAPAPKAKEPPGSLRLLTASTLPSRKPLQVRNLRDVPEFVPRRRHVPMVMRHVGGPPRHSTRSTVAVTRDAATQVIARMESQAGFNVRQWLIGTGEQRMASIAGGRRAALGRCA